MRFPASRLLAVAAAVISSASLTITSAHAAEPVSIGFFSHLSGNFAEYGTSFKNAVELYLDKVNAKGGVEGHPVKLIVEDDRNSPQEAAAVARKIVATPGVVLAIGSWSTTASLAAAPIFTEAKIPQLNPEGVFLALPYQEASIFIQQLRQAGVNVPVGGGIPLTSPKFIELAGKASEGVVAHSIFFAGDPSKKAFVDEYKAKYGRAPDQFAALAYDAAGVGVEAIRRVIKSGKPLTGQAVRDELANGPAFKGVTGVTKYDNGNVKKDPTFITVRNGEYQLF